MTNYKKKPIKRSYTSSYYKLSDVVQKISDGRYLIKPNAIRDAFQQFGWDSSDIKAAFRKLKVSDFYKTDHSNYIPGVAIDTYKATINGEKIYTHFYIDNSSNKVVINSFKEQ